MAKSVRSQHDSTLVRSNAPTTNFSSSNNPLLELLVLGGEIEDDQVNLNAFRYEFLRIKLI